MALLFPVSAWAINQQREHNPLTIGPSATMGLVFFGAAILAVPSDMPLDPSGDIDWIGSAMALVGMILFNFVWK